MLPVGGVGFARIGGTSGLNITPGAISKACKMGGRLVLNGERGEGAIARHPGVETSRFGAVLRDGAEISSK